MPKLSIDDIINKIKLEETFEATALDGSFDIKINRYVPYVCTAIHAGHNFRDELKTKCIHTEFERWFEEDPFTDDFISSLPITLIGNDSRFEYDLNRSPENCIYDEAWGKKVWKKPLTKSEKATSLQKHSNYYKVTHALITKLEEKFKSCIVFDMHSYNYKRWDRPVPVFNIGCEAVDREKYDKYINKFNTELDNIDFRGIDSKSAINDVFQGRGNNLLYITEHFNNTLVLATEVKKIYCNELTGEPYPEEIKYLTRQLKKAILNTASLFAEEQTNITVTNKSKLLTKEIDKNLIQVDKQLYKILKSFELLSFVNPINIDREEKRFFKNKETENPNFKYAPILIDSFELKKELYSVEVNKIEDVTIRKMYEGVINAFALKTDMLSQLGKDRFLYSSLGYFGQPSKKDIRNAKYLLSLPNIKSDQKIHKKLTVADAKKAFTDSFESYGFNGNIGMNKDMASDVMVINSKKKVLIKHNAEFTPKELNYLVHHEIGVHMVTTMNSIAQPLKIFNLGLPINTRTQEGLAVLAEYLSGNITLKRLRTLALRVIAVDMMVGGAEFKETFYYLSKEYKEEKSELFNLVTRVYRGGGFTKDYLYLAGFCEMYKKWKLGYDLTPLLIGKTSDKHYNIIAEMMDRGFLNKPQYITECFENPVPEKNHEIYEYIVDGLI